MSQPKATNSRIELPPTNSLPIAAKEQQHHANTISLLYSNTGQTNSFCPNPDELVSDHKHIIPTSKHTRTRSMMASQSVLKGRVDMVNKSRENSLNHRSNSINDEDSFRFDFGNQEESKAEHPYCCFCVPIISPLSLGHSLWDLYIALVLIVSLTSLPVGMAFDEVGDSMFVMNVVIDIFFICDIGVTFATGFVDENDVLIMEPTPIALGYLKSWFFMDVIASVPMDLILHLIEESQKTENLDAAELANLTKLFKMMRLVRMLKLVRLFRLSRVAKYVRSFRLWLQHHLMFQIPQAFLQIGKLVIVLVIVAHWLGCTFFMISKQFDHPFDSWVVQSGLIRKSTGEKYAWSFLKALYMIIGGEEMLPSGNGIGCNDVDEYCAVESWMSMIALYIGIVFSALLISEVGVIVGALDRSRQLYHDKLQEANEYMRANKLSPELREHVREYFALRYSDQKMFHEQTILEDLSPNLRTRIREEVSSNIVTRVPILHENDKNHAFIDGIVTQLKGPLICFVGEVIFYEGTTGHEMYFIYSGVVGIFSRAGADPVHHKDEDPEGVAVAAISNGCFFGEVALLLNEKRTATARSETITVLHTLNQDALKECLEDVPSIRDYLMHIANRRKKRVEQIHPDFTGEIDTTFESSHYVDMEDAKTPLFKYDQAMTRRNSAKEKRKQRTSARTKVLSFDKKQQQQKIQNNVLQKLRRQSVNAVSKTKEKRRRRSSARLQQETASLSSISEAGTKDMRSDDEDMYMYPDSSADTCSTPGSPVRSMLSERDVGLMMQEVEEDEEKEKETKMEMVKEASEMGEKEEEK